MTHYMKLHAEPFEKICIGEKTFELRLNDEKRRRIRIGDVIVFSNASDEARTVTVKVLALHHFSDFAELYRKLPLDRCGFTHETAVNAHYSDMNKYYSTEEQRKYGVLAIEIEKYV